jgi:quinol-cytochrome oxidoreductase complex cytochrome b subunit
MLVVLINGLILPGPASSGELVTAFYLAFFLHAGFTFYDGSFGTLRTVTWLLLIAGCVGPVIAGFFGYALIWGQLKFWLVSQIAALPVVGETFAQWFARNVQQMPEIPEPSPILLLLLLGLDSAVMHREAWRESSPLQIGIFLAVACAGALILGLAAGLLIGSPEPGAHEMADVGTLPTPPKILPDWYVLPYYALLRSIPNKLAGAGVMFAAMGVPAIWPWMGAHVLRTDPTRWVWPLLCVTQAAVWTGLGYLGSRPPDPPVIQATQMLAVLYFAFFLVWPPLLRIAVKL